MKKMNKKQKMELRLQLAKDSFECKKEYLDNLIETLVEHSIKEVAHQATSFDTLWRNEMGRNIELIEECNLSEKKKNELKMIAAQFFTSKEEIKEKEKSGMTDEEWNVKRNTEYLDKQIKEANIMLEHLNYDTKKEIIKTCITKRLFWYGALSANSKITKEVKNEKTKAV